MDDLSDFIVILNAYYPQNKSSRVPCPFIKWVERRNHMIRSMIQYVESNNKK